MTYDFPIRDEAALILCSASRADGIVVLDRLVNEISKPIRVLDMIFKLALTVLIVAAGLTMLYLAVTDHSPNSAPTAWFLFATSITMIGIEFVVWQKIQHNKFGLRLARLKSHSIPEALQKLILQYAGEDKRVFTKSGTVPSGIFASHWAILLFSKESEVRGCVRSKNGKCESSEMYSSGLMVKQTRLLSQPLVHNSEAKTPDYVSIASPHYKNCDGNNEPENNNSNPDHQWLVGTTRDEYEKSRARAFGHEPPIIQEWKSFVLDGGRFELRSGGQTKAMALAVREIQKELGRRFGSDLTPHGKNSSASIRRMLSTGQHNAPLRTHFLR